MGCCWIEACKLRKSFIDRPVHSLAVTQRTLHTDGYLQCRRQPV